LPFAHVFNPLPEFRLGTRPICYHL
jgi:hypothetical protein